MNVKLRTIVRLLTLLGAAPLFCVSAPARGMNPHSAPGLIVLEPYLEGHRTFKARLDAFAGRVITLDIGNRQLVIETPKSLKARIAAAKEVPVQFIKEAEGYSTTIAAARDTPKGRIWMHLDSGSPFEDPHMSKTSSSTVISAHPLFRVGF